MELRTCRKCGEAKPISEFDFRADRHTYRTECKACRRLRQRLPIDLKKSRTRWFVGNPELLPCGICGVFKPWMDFPRRGKDSNHLQSWCKACFAVYKAQRHQTHHDSEMRRIRKNSAARVARSRALVLDYLRTHPCVDCGETDVIVLEFDHVRDTKIADVSTLMRNGHSWQKIEAEIAKCEVRCSNCHQRVTASRRKSRYAIAEESALYEFIASPRARRGTIPRPADSKSAALIQLSYGLVSLSA